MLWRTPILYFPHYDPAPYEESFDQSTRLPDTPVGSAQLSTAGRVVPDRPGPLDREVRPNKARSNPTYVDNIGV